MGENTRVFETYDDLKNWFFYEMKLTDTIMANELAMSKWGQALKDPTISNIWVFYVCAGMDRFFPRINFANIDTLT